jgi:hypothetical protein
MEHSNRYYIKYNNHIILPFEKFLHSETHLVQAFEIKDCGVMATE